MLQTHLDPNGEGMDDLLIWQEFIEQLRRGEWPNDRLRPYHGIEELKEQLKKWLKIIGSKVDNLDLQTIPKIHRVGKQVHYLIPLTIDGERATYCFTIVVEDKKWCFQHLECITIPIYEIPQLPCSSFPDLPEERKHWMRAEVQITKDVRLWNFLCKEKGKDFAFKWFLDGRGYVVGVRAWMPFLPVHEAFVLFVCWEESIQKGNNVTLVKLDENEAIIRFDRLIYFDLYKRTGHLSAQISEEDYRKLFEMVWENRCAEAGWSLEISYERETVKFHLRKLHGTSPNTG